MRALFGERRGVSSRRFFRIAKAFEMPIAVNPDFNLRIEQPIATYFLDIAFG